MAYTSSTLIENYLQRTLNANETALLAILIPAIKVWLDRKLNSTFDSATETTRYYDGGVKNLDIDPCTNITDVDSLNDDGTSGYDYDLTTTPEVLFEPRNETVKREIRKRNGRFPSGIQNIAVTATFSEYDGGVPTDIQTVATILAAAVLIASVQSNNSDVASESLEGHTITYKNVNEIIDKTATEDPMILSILELRRELYVE